MDPIQVRYDQGILLPELDLWLDPSRGKPRAFISHAHSDHFARHQWTLCSEATADLIQVRYGTRRQGTTVAQSFMEPLVIGGFSLQLLPAGHILGSAMLQVTRLKDGATLLYTGDFKLRDSLSTEPARLIKTDTLIMETTFGIPLYLFPPRSEVVRDMHRFVQECIAADAVPVLLGYSLGKAQELIAMLANCGHPIMVHDSIIKFTDVFQKHGISLPPHRVLAEEEVVGHVVVTPPNAMRALSSLKATRVAMATGWALMKGAKYRFKVDELFPVSDHADHPELLQCVAQTEAKHIFTVHGFTKEFARELRLTGHDAWSLLKEEQREFML
jgi:DNA ligase 1